jgi:hypothetical protein
MKAFTAKFSDLAGESNPTGIWSPAYLALKLAVDRGDEPKNIIQALYDWLAQRKISPHEVDAILDLEPEAAFEALVQMVNRSIKPSSVPAPVKNTLHRVIAQIASNYVEREQQTLDQRVQRLAAMRRRFSTESATGVVAHLLK